MVHTFKFGGRRFAYDSVCGALYSIDELAYKMLDYIELPMPKDCPSALRYDLAKYDSIAIGATYDELYKLYAGGRLYAAEPAENESEPAPEHTSSGVVIKSGNAVVCSHSAPHLPENAEALYISDAAEDSLTAEDLPELEKEIDKKTRGILKSESGAQLFAPVKPSLHSFKPCRGCWANRLCSAECPLEVRCQLERKRIECGLALGGIDAERN